MKQSLNIAVFSDNYLPHISGVSSVVDTLRKELSILGHNVFVFTISYPGFTENTENIFRLPSLPFVLDKACRISPFYSVKLMKKLKELNIDIIHTHTEFSIGIFGRIAAKALGIPFIHTYHTMYEDWVYNSLGNSLFTAGIGKGITQYTKAHCNSASELIVPSQKVKDFLLQNGFKTKITILPSGIDLTKFNEVNAVYDKAKIDALKQELGLRTNDKILLNLGRVSKEKNTEAILNAMPHILNNRPNTSLVIIGDGPNRTALESLAKNLKIESNVFFLGKKPKLGIEKYYKLADFFITASTFETQGLTVMEAMAAGIPIIVKKDKAFDGVIEEGVTGFIFNKDEELADTVLSIIDDEPRISIIKQNVLESVKRFSAESFAQNMDAIYRRNLKK